MTRNFQTPTPAIPPSERRVLREQEVADRWGMSVKTLQRWRCMALGPRFLKLGNRVGYRIEDVEQFERQASRRSTGGQAYA